MPVLSHLYHLFNAEPCQAYIHTPGGKTGRGNVLSSVGQPQGSSRATGDQRFHGADGPEGSGHGGPSGQSALHRLGEQLSGGEGLSP